MLLYLFIRINPSARVSRRPLYFIVISFLSFLAEIQKASIALQNFSSKSVSRSFFGARLSRKYFRLLRGSRPRLSFQSAKWVPSQKKILFALISPNFLFLPFLYSSQFADLDRRFDLCVSCGNLELTETFHSKEVCRNLPAELLCHE